MEIDDYIVADDRALADLVLRGDEAAFEHLFNRYRSAFHRLFVQRTGSATDADDLLQETFIKIYLNLHRYNPDYTFGQWAYTVARNTFIDFARKRQEGLFLDDRSSAAPSLTPTPEERVINQQQHMKIERSLRSMPERYRQLAVLRFLDEYSYEEIAEKLAMPIGTVKTRIHRAREQLFALLTKEE